MPVLQRIADSLVTTPGDVVVSGHTDDVPISTRRFRSNWELSSARAVTVLHALLGNPNLEPHRVMVEGRAETLPLVPNDSPDNRARNRRVEIMVERDWREELDQRRIEGQLDAINQ